MIISAFPACGKTYAYEKMKNIEGLNVLDSDSGQFSWIWETEWKDDYEKGSIPVKVRKHNPDFPKNYIAYIKENMANIDYLFVSSHKVVRDALKENNIPYVLVYPERDRLNEWIGRSYIRGNKAFIDTMIEHWDEWITECENEDGCTEKIPLKSGYLWDLIEERSK